MMSCAETVKHIHEFLDKELDVTRRLVVSNHITACSDCRQRYEFEMGLRALIKAHCVNTVAPAYLHDRIIKSLTSFGIYQPDIEEKQPANKSKIIRLFASKRFYSIAASILILLGGGVFYYANYQGASIPSVVDAVVSNHVMAVNDNLVFNETTSIVGNINKKRNYSVMGNTSALIDTELISIPGGVPARQPGTGNPCVVFNKDGYKVSLQVLGNGNIPCRNLEKVVLGNKEYYLGNCKGFNAVIWKDERQAYCLTSDIAKDELLKFAMNLPLR